MRVGRLVLDGRIIRVILSNQDSAVLIGQKRESAAALAGPSAAFAHPFTDEESERRPTRVGFVRLCQESSDAEKQNTQCPNTCHKTVSALCSRRPAVVTVPIFTSIN